jgi:uncharacterized protein
MSMFPSTSPGLNLHYCPPTAAEAAGALKARPLAAAEEAEVLAFLAVRPIHTAALASFIRDNGLVSPLNRGTFYGCRDAEGLLVGVALIGHATLIETESDEALAAFALAARACPNTHVMMGETDKLERFWQYYSEDGRSPRLVCREHLMEQSWPVEVREAVPSLRLAAAADLEQVMTVQAEMALAESGVDPRAKDPEGFRRRCARRIEQGRVWVWTEEGRLVFKADIISETPDVIYLEGVWVAPDRRGQSLGRRCLSQLSRELLGRVRAVTLLVNDKLPGVLSFYRRAGYRLRSQYDTIYLHTQH